MIHFEIQYTLPKSDVRYVADWFAPSAQEAFKAFMQENPEATVFEVKVIEGL